MKVLFAVSNEEISEAIVKRYQKQYKEIISYKNVYYFNAILKEIQKDKTYDRIVISEELEAFTNSQYEQIDRFIFDKLDSISDEAADNRGENTPIILICSDRRTKGEEMLVKLFGIGVYDALIGSDRGIEEVCNLIYKPRSKKDAKLYYKIEADEVKYQSENENDVSEQEIQNILAHYKKLGKNEEKYVISFDNIVAQYNDAQLRIISKFLPLNVRAVLEEKSPKYQQIMSFNNTVTDNIRKQKSKTDNLGPSGKLLKPKNKPVMTTEPIIIPSSVNTTSVKKLSRNHSQASNNGIQNLEQDDLNELNDIFGNDNDDFINNNQNVQDQNYFEDNQQEDNIFDNSQYDTFSQDNNQNDRFEQNNQQEYNAFDGNNQQQYDSFSSNNEQQYDPFGSNNQQQYEPFGSNNGQQYDPFGNNNQQQYDPFGSNNGQQYDPFGSNNQQQYDPFGSNNGQYDPFGSNNQQQYDPFGSNNNQNEEEQFNSIEQDTIENDKKQNRKEVEEEVAPAPKRRGRPRKNPVQPKEEVLPGFEDYNSNIDNTTKFEEDSILPGFDRTEQENSDNNFNTLPGFEDEQEDNILPGFNDYSENSNNMNNHKNQIDENNQFNNNQFEDNGYANNQYGNNQFDNNGYANNQYGNNQFDNNGYANNQYDNNQFDNKGYANNQYDNNQFDNNGYANNQYGSNQFDNNAYGNNQYSNQYDNNGYTNSQYGSQGVNNNYVNPQYSQYGNSGDELARLLTENKRIATFVGTSKNGTSFIVNNLAEYASSVGINVAIFDTTKNKNSYYIYTKNEEELRQVAAKCLEGLANGQANGISVNKNLTVYTSLPEDRAELSSVTTILETLIRVHDLVLIDCDFDTPMEYFANSSETYLVQSYDILTIQPLTAFLRELKAHNMLDQNKIKILLNKNVKVRGITDKTIIGGMSKYNDPAMSFMTDLFDINSVKSMPIQFEQDIYTRYLESVINCDVSIKGYSKTFLQTLRDLCGWVYPSVPGNNSYRPQAQMYSNTTFSANMNDTLNQMRRKY